MLLRTAIVLSLAVTGSTEEPAASCPSLLQAQQTRSARSLVAGNLAEGAPSSQESRKPSAALLSKQQQVPYPASMTSWISTADSAVKATAALKTSPAAKPATGPKGVALMNATSVQPAEEEKKENEKEDTAKTSTAAEAPAAADAKSSTAAEEATAAVAPVSATTEQPSEEENEENEEEATANASPAANANEEANAPLEEKQEETTNSSSAAKATGEADAPLEEKQEKPANSSTAGKATGEADAPLEEKQKETTNSSTAAKATEAANAPSEEGKEEEEEEEEEGASSSTAAKEAAAAAPSEEGSEEAGASSSTAAKATAADEAGTVAKPAPPAAKPAPQGRLVSPEEFAQPDDARTPDGAAKAALPAPPVPQAGYAGLPDEVIEKMIVSTPWKCDLLPQGYVDPRAPTCGLPFSETGLHPDYQTALGNGSYDHLNTIRMFYPIGALPCCSTMPYCAAPACATPATKASALPGQKCTKRSPADNFAYMSSVEAWPAFHGKSGSYELDVTKHLDIIGTLLRQDGRPEPVDLVIDIGFNSGFITEKLTTRHFGKNYILVEAFKGMLDLFKTRLGNATFKEQWFNQQVPAKSGAVIPDFEFLNVAVSNQSGGVLDLCVGDDTMWNGPNNGTPCPVDKVALDEVIPSRLSPAFQTAFAKAESAYMKVDVEGYDQMALEGLERVLQEQRGKYGDGAPRHLVNFIQLEACQSCIEKVKATENRTEYDVGTVKTFLESMGFETFLMGPRYIPLSHGSWDDAFNVFFNDPMNSNIRNYPGFNQWCPGPECPGDAIYNTFTADLFAMRTSHPRATEIKLALGSCQESRDFSLTDPQYETAAKSAN